MNSYEVVCAFDPKLSEEKIDSIISKVEKKIKDMGGEFEKVEKWGIKKLTYTIKRAKGAKEAYYIVIDFKGGGSLPPEILNILKVTEGIIRYLLTVKKGPTLEGFLKAKEEEKVEIEPSMLESQTPGTE